jgi:ribulose 1,5-bisphosphate synthetase/thiazole synthase
LFLNKKGGHMKLDEIVISRAIIESYKDKLIKALDVDVAIVGGGPAGMVCGYYLKKAFCRGRDVGWWYNV